MDTSESFLTRLH